MTAPLAIADRPRRDPGRDAAKLGVRWLSNGGNPVPENTLPGASSIMNKATRSGFVTEADLDAIARNIRSAYEHADFVGSLVVPADDPRRPTAWQKIPGEWFPW